MKVIDLSKLYKPSKNKKQLEAHNSPEKYILYGGAKGGGKTAWLVNEAIALSLDFPGNRGFLGCKIGRDFKENALKQLEKFLHPELVAEHKKVAQQIRLINGSVIMYGGLGNDEEAVQTINNMPELGWFGIDQAEQISERQFRLLSGQLRLVLPNIHYRGMLTANPEPGWLRDLFIEQDLPDYKFIPALPKDNPFLPKEYVDNLKKQFPPELVKRLVEGDWDVELKGNYLFPYPRIREAVRKVIEPKGDVVAGLDIAWRGTDETVVLIRQGDVVLYIDSWAGMDTPFSAGEIAKILRQYKPKAIFMESVGVGVGVYDPLKNAEDGFLVNAVYPSVPAQNDKIYANKRAEAYAKLAKKFEEGTIDIPDNSKLQRQLSSITYTYDAKTRMLIEDKKTIRKELGSSPDYADALMLAFMGAPSNPVEPISTLDFPRRFR